MEKLNQKLIVNNIIISNDITTNTIMTSTKVELNDIDIKNVDGFEYLKTIPDGSIDSRYLCVAAEQPLHAGHQVPVRSLDDEMEVIGPQAVSVNLEIGLPANLGQSLEKIMAIDLIVEGVLPTVPAAHQVVNGTRIAS